MNANERVAARLQGKSVDKIPNLNIAMALVAKCASVPYSVYVQDYRRLVEGNLICAEKFGFDTVSVISDPVREASAFGAEIVFPENGVPYAIPLLDGDEADLKKLQIIDPHAALRTLDRIKGVELLREKAGKDYPVVGWVEGVLAEVGDLRGTNRLMLDVIEGENWFEELLEVVLEQQKRFALAQIQAGADFIGIGNAVASLIGPALYEEHALRYDRDLVNFIRANGAKAKLHICGNITPLLPLLKQVEPDILDVDWMVDFKQAVDTFADLKTSVSGNLDPVAILMQGNSEAVEKATRACIAAADDTACIAAGCEVPADSPEENLIAMNRLLYL